MASAMPPERRRGVIHATTGAVALEAARDMQLSARNAAPEGSRGTADARRRAPSSSSARLARRRCRTRRASDAGRRHSRAARHRSASSVEGSMRGPQTATMRRCGHEAARCRLGGEHALEQMRADARAADCDQADLLILTPSELAAQRGALGGRWAASKPVMCPHEVIALLDPAAVSPAGPGPKLPSTMSAGSPTKIAWSRTRGKRSTCSTISPL